MENHSKREIQTQRSFHRHAINNKNNNTVILEPLSAPGSSGSFSKCNKCNRMIQAEWIYCESCGSKLQPSRSFHKASIPTLTSLRLQSTPSTLNLPSIQQINQKYSNNSCQQKRTELKPTQKKKSPSNDITKLRKKQKILKELEEKRFQKAQTVLRQFEAQNENMVKYYQKMMTKIEEKSSLSSLNQSLNPSLSYLDEQPSIIERLQNGFTAEENAERVLFWGQQQQNEIDKENEAMKTPHLFPSIYWGQQTEDSEDNDPVDNSSQSDMYQDSHSFDHADNDENDLINPNTQDDIYPGVHWSQISETIPTDDIREEDEQQEQQQEQQQEEEEEQRNEEEEEEEVRISSLEIEGIRRKITRYLLKIIHLLKWILKGIDCDIVIDPLTIPGSLQRYSRYCIRLTAGMTRAYEVQMTVHELAQQYLATANHLRHRYAYQIAEIQLEADRVYQQCHELYQCVTSGVFLTSDCQPNFDHTTISDPVLIQRNQQRVLEYSKEILDPVRLHINHLIAKEYQIITHLQDDDMALRTAQEQYQPKVMDLILTCKTALARAQSLRRWIAARIIQRFVRSALSD